LKSRYGSETVETPRDQAFCAHTILETSRWCAGREDDERFSDNPLVTGKPHIRFTPGTRSRRRTAVWWGRCAPWTTSRDPSDEDLAMLRDLAMIAQNELNLNEVTLAYKMQRQTEENCA